MSKRKDGQARGKYTLEFKLEAVRLVKGGQALAVTAKVLGVPVQTLGNWVRLSEKGQLKGVGDKPVSPEQMEISKEIPLPRSLVLQKAKNRAIPYDSRENLVLPVFSGD